MRIDNISSRNFSSLNAIDTAARDDVEKLSESPPDASEIPDDIYQQVVKEMVLAQMLAQWRTEIMTTKPEEQEW